VNNIENLLKDAAVTPAKRPEFYRALLSSELVCLGTVEQDASRSKVGLAVGNVEGGPAILAFTSKEALQWFADLVQQSNMSYVVGRADELFEMMIANKLGMVLNHGHQYGKHFTAPEIEGLLKMRTNDLGEEKNTIGKGQEIMVGQPKEIPKNLVIALAQYLKEGKSKATEIYFGVIIIGADTDKKTDSIEYLGAVEFAAGTSLEEEDRALKDIMIVSKESVGAGEAYNVCKLRESGFPAAIVGRSLKPVSSFVF
jgi:hypothetical protein